MATTLPAKMIYVPVMNAMVYLYKLGSPLNNNVTFIKLNFQSDITFEITVRMILLRFNYLKISRFY